MPVILIGKLCKCKPSTALVHPSSTLPHYTTHCADAYIHCPSPPLCSALVHPFPQPWATIPYCPGPTMLTAMVSPCHYPGPPLPVALAQPLPTTLVHYSTLSCSPPELPWSTPTVLAHPPHYPRPYPNCPGQPLPTALVHIFLLL